LITKEQATDSLPGASAGLRFAACGALTAILRVQSVDGTVLGVSNGRNLYAFNEVRARALVNLIQVPQSDKVCYFDIAVWSGWYPVHLLWVGTAKQNHLTVFQSEVERQYRTEGLPVLSQCNQG